MAPKTSPLQRLTGILALSVAIVFLVSCQNENKPENDGKAGGSGNQALQSGSFQMNCVILTKAQVQAWKDSGWLTPADSNKMAKRILLQFYSADASGANSNMQLVAYPARSYTDVYANGRVPLEIDTTCVAKQLSGPNIFANNFIGIKKLKIIKPNGDLEDFSFIRFRPVQSFPPFLNFDVEVVRIAGAQEQVLQKGGGSDPCPPYCPEGDDSF